MKFTIRELCLVTVCAALAVNSCRLEMAIGRVSRFTDADAANIYDLQRSLDRHSWRLIGAEARQRLTDERVRILEAKRETPVSSRPDEIHGCPEAVRQPASPQY